MGLQDQPSSGLRGLLDPVSGSIGLLDLAFGGGLKALKPRTEERSPPAVRIQHSKGGPKIKGKEVIQCVTEENMACPKKLTMANGRQNMESKKNGGDSKGPRCGSLLAEQTEEGGKRNNEEEDDLPSTTLNVEEGEGVCTEIVTSTEGEIGEIIEKKEPIYPHQRKSRDVSREDYGNRFEGSIC